MNMFVFFHELLRVLEGNRDPWPLRGPRNPDNPRITNTNEKKKNEIFFWFFFSFVFVTHKTWRCRCLKRNRVYDPRGPRNPW
jgi:hypothetical protein